MNPRQELWVLPHTLHRLGLANVKLERHADARAAFEQALRYEEYDWEVSLRDQTERELESMAEEK
jgi:hypothetical protein